MARLDEGANHRSPGIVNGALKTAEATPQKVPAAAVGTEAQKVKEGNRASLRAKMPNGTHC